MGKTETKERNVMFYKAGGNAGKNAMGARISIPKPWLDKMNITEKERSVIITFKGNKIIIEKLADK